MISLLIFLVSFAIYLPQVSPILHGGDTGELIANSFVIGVPHAPGFPTYQILAKTSQILIPFANISYRTNLFSAILGSFTLTCLWVFLSKGHRFPKAAIFLGILFLGLSPLYIEQSIVAEVFVLNLLFFIGVLWALTLNQKKEGLSLASYLLGVGLGNHHILITSLPLIIYAWFHEKSRARMLLGSLFFFLLGFSVYAYLPIRARTNPPVNFGDPETWSRFWAVLTRKEFGSFSLHPAAVPFYDVPLLVQQAVAYFVRTWAQVGLFGMGLVLLGLGSFFLERENRPVVGAALLGWLGIGFAFELTSNLSPGSSIGQWRLERFFLLSLFSLAVLMIVGLSFIFRRKGWVKVCFMGLVLFALVEKGMGFLRQDSLRQNFVFRDFSESFLRSAKRGETIIIDRVLFDEPTSALLNQIVVEGKRPDLTFYYRPGTLFNQNYGEDFLELSWKKRLERQEDVEKELLQKKGDEVSFFGFEKGNVPFKNAVLNGFLYKSNQRSKSENIPAPSHALPPGKFSDLDRSFLINRLEDDGLTHHQSRLMETHFPYYEAKSRAEKKLWDEAQPWFKLAESKGDGMDWLYTNLGGIWVGGEFYDQAKEAYEKAVTLNPYFYPAQFGLGFVELKLENYANAASAYQSAVKCDPTNPEAYYMLGVTHAHSGDIASAKKVWGQYLQMEPGSPYKKSIEDYLNER